MKTSRTTNKQSKSKVMNLTQSLNNEKNGTANVTIEFIYNQYYKQIVSFIKVRTNYAIESEEIAQDVFLKANEHLAKYDVLKAKVNTWLYTIAKNKVIDFYRANKNASNISHVDGWTDSEGKETYQLEGTCNVETIESKETNEQIMNAMSSLNKKEQVIAKMYFFEDKQYNEISELLNIPMGSVKGMLSRIRVKLQEKLQSVYTSI